jgi:hypothetical protein
MNDMLWMFVSTALMCGAAMLLASTLMFVVNLAVQVYRSYHVAKGTWRLSAREQAKLERWATYLATAQHVVHLAVMVALVVAFALAYQGFMQQWQYVLVLLISWAFLITVLRSAVAMLLQMVDKLPPSWYSRWRSRHKDRPPPTAFDPSWDKPTMEE